MTATLCPVCGRAYRWCYRCDLPTPCCPTAAPDHVLQPGERTFCLIDHDSGMDPVTKGWLTAIALVGLLVAGVLLVVAGTLLA